MRRSCAGARSLRAAVRWAAVAALVGTTVAVAGTPVLAGAPDDGPVSAMAGAPSGGLPETLATRWRSVSTAAADKSETLSYPHTCGIRIAGSLWCWGDAAANLGDGARLRLELAPRQVGSSTDWRSLVSSTRYTCAIDGAEDLWCWGTNSRGQLGDGTLTARDEPGKVSGPTGWVVVDATYVHTCGITKDRLLWCWGANSSGQLGDGSNSDRSVPTNIGAATIGQQSRSDRPGSTSPAHMGTRAPWRLPGRCGAGVRTTSASSGSATPAAVGHRPRSAATRTG